VNPFRDAFSYASVLLWIRDKRGQVVPFSPNPTQKLIQRRKRDAVLAGRPRRFLIPKARRMGVTTWEQAVSFSFCATRDGKRCVTLANNLEKSRDIFNIANLFWERLPPELQPIRDSDSKSALRFKKPSSEFFIGTAGSVSYGRGDTLQRVHGSEVAFWMPGRAQDLVESLIAGLTEAASHGEVVLESTANGNVGWWHDTVMEAWNGGKNDGNEWTVIFLPWWTDPTYRIQVASEQEREILDTLTDREKWLIAEHKLDVAQIAWRRAKTHERSMRRLFLQEYPETLPESFIGSERCFFDADQIAWMAQSVEAPRADGNGLFTWEDPQPGAKYVIGADVAEGVPEGDYSAAYVLEFDSGRPVAGYHGRCRPEQFAEFLAKLGRRYNQALIGPERNNHGHATLVELVRHISYGNVYFEREPSTAAAATMSRPQIKFGWATTTLSRPVMLDDLREALEAGWRPRCEGLLAEAKTFEDDGTGTFQARSGKHDDRVIAMAIALQVRKRAPALPTVSMI
jgi:hypothetical protein